MRKNDRFEQGLTATGAARRAKVFGIKSMTVVMTAAMLLSGVPTSAIAEELQEAGVVATQDSTEQAESGEQQATEQSNTQEQSQVTSQQGTQSSSRDNAAATQNSSQSAQPVQQATTAGIALTLNNASITYKGQVIAQPAQKVTASTSDNFQFTVQPDNGYKLNRVKLTLNGSDRELKADANGLYTVSAADVAQSPRITLETEQEKNGETAEEATPIEDTSKAVATQGAEDTDGANAVEFEVGSTKTLKAQHKSYQHWDGKYVWGSWQLADNQNNCVSVVSGWGSSETFELRGTDTGTATVVYTYKDANDQECRETYNVTVSDTADSTKCGITGPTKVLTDDEITLTESKKDVKEWHIRCDDGYNAYDCAQISANGDKLTVKGLYHFTGGSKKVIVQCVYQVPNTNKKYTDEYEITVQKRTWKITDWTYVEGTHFCTPTVVDSITGKTIPEWEGGYRKEYFINGVSVDNAPWTGAFKDDANTYEVKIYPFGQGTSDAWNSKYYGETVEADPIPNKEKTPIASDDPSDVNYDGQEHKWVPTVTDKETKETLDSSEYDVIYKRDGKVTDDFTTPGTITVEIKGKHHHTGDIEKTYTIREKKIELSVSGPDTVEQFNKIQLTPSLSPAQKGGTYSWASNNENILTVDKNGKVTGVSEGKATVTVTWTSADGKTVLTADHDVTVTHTTNGTADFTFYYLNDPSGNLDSTNTGNWQKLGKGRVNLTGYNNSNFPKDNGVTKKYDAKARVTKWPDGSTTPTLSVKRGSNDWNLIVKMYQSEIKRQLPNVEVKDSDIESIELVPYKLTRNDDGYHVDCQVVVKCKGLYTVKYWVDDPTVAGEGYQQVAVTTTAREGDSTNISDFNQTYPETKTVNGVEYTFSGWFLDEGLTKSASLPYVVRNSNLNFYAKYVAGRMVKYDLDGGSWKNGAGTTYKVGAGKTHTVLGEPTREGYEFAGWTISGLDGKTSINSGDTFTMPDNNVFITAQWKKKSATVTVNYLWGDKDSHKLIESDTLTGDHAFEDVIDVAKDFVGYTVKPGQSTKRVLDAGENVINVYYYKNVTLTAKSDTKTYNGDEQTVEGYTSSVDAAKFDGVTAKGSGTDAGEYNVTFSKDYTGTVSKDTKYIVSETKPGKLTISPIAKEIVITITGHTGGEKYSGKEQTVKGYDVSGLPKGVSENDVLYDGTAEAKGTDAGAYNMNLDAAKFSLKGSVAKNYSKVTFKVAEDGKLTIAKRKVTLTSDSGNKKYDGTTITRRGVTVSGDGFVKGENVSQNYTWQDDNNILPGTYKNKFDYELKKGTNKDNYEIKTVFGDLVINDREENDKLEITLKGNSATTTYDGGDHTLSGVENDGTVEVGGVQYRVVGYTTSNLKERNADTYKNVVNVKNAKVFDEAGNDVTKQFSVKAEDGKLVINKAEATITSRSGVHKYDGKAYTLHEFDCTGFVETDKPQFDDVEWTGSQTKIGESDNTFKYEPTDRIAKNYYVTCKFGKLKVTNNDDEVVVNIVMNSGSVPYDGQSHSVNGYTVTSITGAEGYSASDIKFNGAAVSGTDAGEYANKGTDENGNSLFENTNSNYTKVKFVVTDGKLTITPRKVTLTSGSDEKVYDGTPLTKNEVTVAEGSFVDGEGFTADVTGSQTDAGTSDNTFNCTLNEGTQAKNYEITTVPGKLKVTPVTDQIVVTVKGKAETVKYDGAEHKLSGYTVESISNQLYTEKDFEYIGNESVKGTDIPATSTSYTKKIAAGTSFKNLSKNFENVVFKSDAPITLTIVPRNITLTAANGSKVYDGNALTNDKVTVTGDGFVEGEGASYTVNGSQTDVGTSDNVVTGWTFNADTKAQNYNVAAEKGMLEVTPVTEKVTVTINGNRESHEYDGGEHTAKGYTVSIDNGRYKESDFSFSGTDSVTAKNVSESRSMGLKAEDFVNTSNNFSNVEFVVNDEGGVAIKPKAATVKSADLSKEYDGEALTNGDAALETTGFIDGEGVVGKDFTGSQTTVGSTDNTYEYDAAEGTDLGNYTIGKQTGTLTVTNRAAKYEITVKAKSTNVTYDGKKHAAKGVDTYEFTENGKKYSVSGLTTEDPEQINAGTYTNNITGTPVVKDAKGNVVTDQFKVNIENGSLTIVKRTVKIKSEDAEKTYDGKPLTEHEVNEAGDGFVKGEGLVYDFTGTQTEAGSSSNSFTYAAKDGTNLNNYDVEKSEGTLKVNPVKDVVTVTINGHNNTVTYNGSEQSISGYDVNIDGSKLYNTNDFSFNGSAEAKGTDASNDAYPMGLTEANFTNNNKNFTNVAFVVKDGRLKINPIDITLTARGATKPYDGTALTNNTVDITSGQFVDGQGVTCTTTGSQTEPGDSDNSFEYVFNDGTKAGNYNITKVSEKLVVTKSDKEVVVTIKPNGDTYTYDGTEHAASGYEVTGISNKLYSENDFTFNGNAKVKATDAGTYNMDIKPNDFVNKSKRFNKVTFVVEENPLVINKKDVQVTTPNASKVYDGTALTAKGSIDGLVKGETVDFKTTGSQTKAGTSNNTYELKWTGSAKKSNYNVLEPSVGTLTVTAQSINPGDGDAYKGITVSDLKDVKYNGGDQKQEPIVKNGNTGLVKGRDYELSYSKDTVNAGEVTVTVKGIGNYTGEVKRIYNITKRHVKLTSNTRSKTYDGTALTDETVAETGEDSFVTGEVTNKRATGSITNPGTVKNTIAYDTSEKFNENNYVIEYQTGALTVDPKSVASKDMTVSKPDNTIYNGKEQKFEPVVKDGEKTLTKGVDYDLSYSDDVTNAGTVTVAVTGKGNYTGTATVEYKIEKRPVTLVSNGGTKYYDGTALEDHDVAVTSKYNFVAGEVDDLKANGSITEPSEATNNITYTKKDGYKDSNYDVKITEGTLKVLPRDLNATGMEISKLDDVVYNGLDQKQAPEVTDSKTDKTLVAGTDYDVKYSDDTKNVGEATVTITGKGNYTGTATRTYKITPAPLTVTTDSASQVYNGRELTAGGKIEGFVNGESVDFKTTGKQKSVGSSANTYSIDWTGAKKTNYSIVSESIGTLTVTESAQTVVVATVGGRYEYDGTTHTPTVNVYNLPDGYTVRDASSNAAVKDVNARKDSDQGVKVTADNLVILNADGEDVTSKLNIEKADDYLAVTPRTVTVTTPSDSKVYDGTALKAEGAITGLVDGETAEFKTTGSQTEQGASKNTYDLKWNGSAKKSNYTVNERIGTLAVTRQSIDKKDEKAYKGVTIDDPASVKYDGGKHQWAPTVTDADGNVLTAGTDYKVSYKRGDDATDDFKNVGTITVTIEGAGNYTGTVTKTYKITKRDVTLTSADDSWTYDGKDHQKTDVAVSGDGFAEGEGVDYSNFATVKDVTSEDVENTFDYAAKKGTDLGNYEITVKTGKLSVSKAAAEGNITLTTKDATKTYDGRALEAGEATAQSATGDDVKIEYSLDHEHWTENRSEVTLKDAGNKTVYVRASSKKNYSGYVEGTETLTVTPATLTIVTPKAEKTYDGKALTAEGSMKGLVNGETAEFKTTGSLTEVGQTDNAYTLSWNGTAKAGNYTVEATVGKLIVNPRSIDDDSYGMSVSSPKDVTYDGSEHKWAPVVKDGEKTLVEGIDYTVAYDKDDFTNVTGTIKVTITGKGNYTGAVDRTYQITPAELTVVTEGASKVYDGEALTHDVATIKGLKNGESATIHATGSQTEVGESNNTYEITWDGSAQQGNYTVASETLGKLAVSESADQITVTPRNVTVQYDGEAHGTTVDVNGLPKGYSVKTATSKATATDVSDGEVTAKVDELVIVNAKGEDVTSKLNIKRGTATIKIAPAPLTVTTAGGKKEYDGTALTAKGIKVDGLKGGDKVSAQTTGSRTKVGKAANTYSIDWTNAKSSNYTVTDELGTLEITPSTAAVTLASSSAERVYNGRALTSDKISAKGLPAGFTVEATMDGTQTDAGSSKNTVANYKILDTKGDDVTDMFANVTVKNGTLTVAPKQITVETEGGTKVYDGTALTNKKGSISGLVSGEHADVVTSGTQTEVGSSDNGYTIAWDSAKAGNYTVASETLGKLTVTPQSVNPDDPAYRNLTVSDPEDATYDGDVHKWAPEVKDADGNVLKEGVDYTLSYNTDDFVDTGTITVTVTGRGNYTGTVSKTYRIKPALISIKTDSASRVYNGRALTAGGGVTGLVNGETVDFKTTGTRTKVGTSDNTYELNWTGSAKKSNYTVHSVELGKLTVTESADQIVVTTMGGTYTYDGKAHGAQVTVSQLPEGYTVDGTPTSDASATDVNGDGIKATVDHLVIRNAEGEDVTSQLKIEKVDGTITITPVPLTVVTDSATKVYDGTALTAGGSVTGLVTGEKATLTLTGTQTEAGSSKNTYKLTFDKTAKAKNYTVTSETIGTLTVTPQSITPVDPTKPDDSYKGVTVDDPSDSIYDGADHKWIPVVKDVDGKTLEEGADYEVSYDSDDFKNVQTINVTITGKGNYTGTVTKSYRITKAPLRIVTGSASKVFDGTALTNGTVTVDGLAQTDRIGITVTGQQLGVGSSKNTYTIDWMQVDQNNYELTDQLGTLTVTAAPVTPQNPTTPGTTPGTTPTTPGNGSTTPAGTGNNVVNTVATALANGYNAVTGSSQSAAPNEEQIFDAKNPLGKYDGKKDTCWVHWYMILCGLVTAVYGLLVCLRRRKHSHRLEEDLKKVLDNDDETQE